METLLRVVKHPIINIVMAIILVATSLAEGWETFLDDLVKFDAGVHHGVLLFGFVMLLRSIIEALEAVKRAHDEAKSVE